MVFDRKKYDADRWRNRTAENIEDRRIYEQKRYNTPHRRAKKKVYDSRYRENPEVQSYHKQYYLNNKDRLNMINKQYYYDNREKALAAAWEKNITKFGMTIDEYYALEKKQNGRCAICKTDRPGGRGRWHIDHNHETGQVRGLLCQKCNMGLGLLEHNYERLVRAHQYLLDHPERLERRRKREAIRKAPL
jgi:hypothetical protein